jgi:excisionase family DNA binding protein
MHANTPAALRSLLTTPEVADVCRCCTKTVTNLIARGQLKAVRLGKAVRVERTELERFIAAGGAR